jgi:transposase InsO family protein
VRGWLDRMGVKTLFIEPGSPWENGYNESFNGKLLKAQIEAFVAQYNHQRYRESLNNLTPANVCFGRGQTILLERERIKRRTIQQRLLLHQHQAA